MFGTMIIELAGKGVNGARDADSDTKALSTTG
jgi:hypothetical protein